MGRTVPAAELGELANPQFLLVFSQPNFVAIHGYDLLIQYFQYVIEHRLFDPRFLNGYDELLGFIVDSIPSDDHGITVLYKMSEILMFRFENKMQDLTNESEFIARVHYVFQVKYCSRLISQLCAAYEELTPGKLVWVEKLSQMLHGCLEGCVNLGYLNYLVMVAFNLGVNGMPNFETAYGAIVKTVIAKLGVSLAHLELFCTNKLLESADSVHMTISQWVALANQPQLVVWHLDANGIFFGLGAGVAVEGVEFPFAAAAA